MSQLKTIDNRGLSCPMPVVNTKKALEELAANPTADFTLTSLVDNETAAENVSRFARNSGYGVTVEKKAEEFIVHIKKSQTDIFPPPEEQKDKELECRVGVGTEGVGETVMIITSSTLGDGSEELGSLLMRSFFFTIKENDTPPARMFFLNGGVSLTVEGSPVLEELQELAARGVEIFSCGTCLDYYNLKDKIQVGQVTNMYDTVDAMLASSRCITL